MASKPFRDDSLKINPDGSFSIEIKTEEEIKKEEESDNIFSVTKELKTVEVGITVTAKGKEVVTLKTTSNVDAGETLVAIARGLIGMTRTTSTVYGLDIEELMNKVRAMIDNEFDLQNKKDE